MVPPRANAGAQRAARGAFARRAGFVTVATGGARDGGRRSRELWGRAWPAPISAPPGSTSRRRSPRAPRSSSTRSRRTISLNVLRLGAGASRAPVQWPRRRIRKRARGDVAQRRLAHRRPANAAAGGAAGRRLSVRAAQARPPRLYGPEGGRDGGAATEADRHPAHPGRARQSRASARQRHRSLRAMRRDLDAGGRRARNARKDAGPLAGRAAHRLLRRGGAAGEPARRAGAK